MNACLKSKGKYNSLCINEHWLSKDSISIGNLEDYEIVSGFGRDSSIHGETVIYADVDNNFVMKPTSKNPRVDFGFIKDSSINISDKFEIFLSLITTAIDTCLPTKTKVRSNKRKTSHWFNENDMSEKLALLRSIHREWPSENLRVSIKSYRKLYRSEIARCSKLYHDNLINRSRNKQGAMSNLIKNYISTPSTISSENIIADDFNNYFTCIAYDLENHIPKGNKTSSDFLRHTCHESSYLKYQPLTYIQVGDTSQNRKHV
ncbi:hypothetical protein JTB14_013236 [Gonioctena quinquepunctata]|nr:hypothetical protein JTB14_013236 [Gonioctena quinquepunctata]